MHLNFPHDVIRSVARFRLRAHTLTIETVTWTHNTSPKLPLFGGYSLETLPYLPYLCFVQCS